MREAILSSLLVSFLCLQSGCSNYPHYAVKTKSIENNKGVHLIDPNDGPYSIKVTQKSDGSHYYQWEIDGQIEQNRPCRVKYHRSYSSKRFMVVEGRVGNSENKYPIVLDTGASQSIFVKDIHVLNNNLSIYPLETDQTATNGYHLGLCHLPELRIGKVALINQPCFYLEKHTKLKLSGPLTAKDNSIIVGLPALRQFKYITFDNIRKEVEFSKDKVFQSQLTELWARYPFSIEEDFHGNAFLFVKIPIAGEKIELQLDTGSGNGLAIAENLWEKIRGKVPNVKLRRGRELYPYIGKLRCKRGIFGKLEVGNRTVRNAKISIFPNDSPLVEDCDGLVGMQYFQDTVVVLDFENELIWVKNPQSR